MLGDRKHLWCYGSAGVDSESEAPAILHVYYASWASIMIVSTWCKSYCPSINDAMLYQMLGTRCNILTPQSITHAQVLVVIEKNGYVTQVFTEAVFTHEQ